MKTHLLKKLGPFLGRFRGGHDGRMVPCPYVDKRCDDLSCIRIGNGHGVGVCCVWVVVGMKAGQLLQAAVVPVAQHLPPVALVGDALKANMEYADRCRRSTAHVMADAAVVAESAKWRDMPPLFPVPVRISHLDGRLLYVENMSQGGSPNELSPLSPTGQDTPGPGPEPEPAPGPTRPVDPGRIRRNTACVRCRDAKVRPVPLITLPRGPRLTPHRSSAMPAPPRVGHASGVPSWGLTVWSTKATSERRGGGSFPASNELELRLLRCCGVESLCTWLQGRSWRRRSPGPGLVPPSSYQHEQPD